MLGWDLQSRACALGCWGLVSSRLCAARNVPVPSSQNITWGTWSLPDTPLKLREVSCTSVSPEVRAGLGGTLLYPVVALSLIIWPETASAGAGGDPAEGTRSAVPTRGHLRRPTVCADRDTRGHETVSVARPGPEGLHPTASPSTC